jgi:hypothetical protein
VDYTRISTCFRLDLNQETVKTNVFLLVLIDFQHALSHYLSKTGTSTLSIIFFKSFWQTEVELLHPCISTSQYVRLSIPTRQFISLNLTLPFGIKTIMYFPR